jgi:hypothetical protein
MRKTCCEFEAENGSKRNTANGWAFQAMPIQKLRQVTGQVGQSETPAEGKAVVLTAKLVTDYAIVLGKQPGQGAEKFKTAR